MFNNFNPRQTQLYRQVESLYKNSYRDISPWIWENHVQKVVEFALELADEYGGNIDYILAGALLHDLGDVWYERDDPQFDTRSVLETQKILNGLKFTSDETTLILNQIIAPHSCYPGNYPQTIEGKILATADALAHIKTNYFQEMKRKGLPKNIAGSFTDWALSKLERDFNNKIFFDDVKNEASSYYQQLKTELSS